MYPKINDLVYIQVDSADDKESQIIYKSRVADIEEQSILIEVPMQENSAQLMHPYMGEELSVYFVSEDGAKNYFNTYLMGFKEDTIRLVRISKPKPEEITKEQRRSFLRVVASLDLAVRMPDGTRFVAQTEDVSGGGVSFFCERDYAVVVGQKISCWLLIPYRNGSVEHVPFQAEIVRVKPLESGRSRKIVMLKFIHISDMERQKIIRYCFERQFEFRNR
ncbi:flagellar brake domain-containing protein [Paenibacillus sediminis]|uniref:C-di-GMP-binding flagellar brake protein YcgR n=1 Tax=Paenibacillus sediminis TaxID=664909 RepID=A0ABS4GZN2_9BACL|nr:flagellar brake domain-containing protein [Paenibacillus sediminis]MBP1935738.1 c-di-GMP-binding flagellar brake protein YcgR [Paenibacillus sediminis]